MLLFLKYDDDYRSFDIDGNQNMEYGVHQSERMIVWTK
jgi:hypothetical protein